MATTKSDPVPPPAAPPAEGAEPKPADAVRIAELERENAELRATLAAAVEANSGNGLKTFTVPQRPSFGLSAGEANDLALHGVANSPFTGERLNAVDEQVKPANKAAQDAARREHERDK